MQNQLDTSEANLAKTTDALNDATAQNEIMASQIAGLQNRLVDGGSASASPPPDAVDVKECSPQEGEVPTISADGADVEVNACGGKVTIRSSSCSVDPCATQAQLNQIQERLDNL